MVCGAWFAVDPVAWPVVFNGSGYFIASTHLRVLAYEVGYSIGTGLVLVVCGAFVDGFATPQAGFIDGGESSVSNFGRQFDTVTVTPGLVPATPPV